MQVGRDTQNAIKQGFFNDLFLMILSDKNMTATEVARRHEEKLAILGPVIERQNSEMLDLVLVDGHAKGIVTRNLITGEIATHAADTVLLGHWHRLGAFRAADRGLAQQVSAALARRRVIFSRSCNFYVLGLPLNPLFSIACNGADIGTCAAFDEDIYFIATNLFDFYFINFDFARRDINLRTFAH